MLQSARRWLFKLEGEVEDKEGFCEACGNKRIIFELALDGIRNEWRIHDSLSSYQQVKFELLFWTFEFF